MIGPEDTERERAAALDKSWDAAGRIVAGDQGEARYDMNEALIDLARLEQQRKQSGRLTSDIEQLARVREISLEQARMELRCSGRTRAYWFGLYLALRCSLEIAARWCVRAIYRRFKL